MQQLRIDNPDAVLTWSYGLAKQWVANNLVPQGVTSARKFDKYKRENKFLPRNFPRLPDEYFKRRGTWKGWRDFLGYPDQKKNSPFVAYRDASRICKMNNIRNSRDYRNWKERPVSLPARPELTYCDEWEGWPIFLGKKYKKDKHGKSMLKSSEIKNIKHQLQMGVSGAFLAKTFKVSEMQISRIRNGENWNDI